MTRTLAFLIASLSLPCAALAQYGDAPPPGYAAPGYVAPGYYGPQPAYAQQTPVAKLEGFELSAGVGAGFPMGSVMKDSSGTDLSFSDIVSSQFPLLVGVGYRANPLFSFAMTFQWAYLSTKNCDPGGSCSGSDSRLGLEGRFHFATDQSFSPWLGIGFGYEWLSLSESGAQSFDMTLKGLDLELLLGGNFRASPTLTLGPYLGLRYGQYDSVDMTISGTSGSGDIPDANQVGHGWLTIGVRGSFTL